MLELDEVAVEFTTETPVLQRLRGERETVRALRNVSISMREGETVGLVGESGCGKSTLAKVVAGIHNPNEGTVWFDGKKINGLAERDHSVLTQVGYVFQNPRSSLDPRWKVGRSVAEPINDRPKDEIETRLAELFDLVGLAERHRMSYPHELSGGQVQRAAIARAIAREPRFVVLDEPVSALDVTTQAKILNLLADLQDELGLAYLFISHDLGVVRHVADRAAVMYLGEIVERGDPTVLFEDPTHPYTEMLVEAIPSVEPENTGGSSEHTEIETGELPDPSNPPTGCSFRTRCPYAEKRCTAEEPDLKQGSTTAARCHFAGELPLLEDDHGTR